MQLILKMTKTQRYQRTVRVGSRNGRGIRQRGMKCTGRTDQRKMHNQVPF